MIAKSGRLAPAFLALLASGWLVPAAFGQGNTFNPYGNNGYPDYREFGTPMLSNNPALPGQSILNNQPLITRQRANSFQQYADELDGSDSQPAARRGAAGNVPYFQAYQRLNSQYNRTYQANNTKGDREFYERQQQRDLAFSKALKEPDPAKRAKLLREVERDSLDRPAAAPRAAAAKGATAPKPAAGTAPAPSARATAPTERRQPAPSPFGTDTVRRPAARAATTAPDPAARPKAATRPAPDPLATPAPSPR